MQVNGYFLSLLFHVVFQIEHLKAKEVVYRFTIGYFQGAPDGVQKNILGVNGQFPGPTIRARIGDLLTVYVTNKIHDTKEGTSIHWHGLEQYKTGFEDGPEMVTQCPIAYNTTQKYQFLIFQSGTYWYHSHHSQQYTEGCWGILIIDNEVEVHHNEYDQGHELVITLNDWYHLPGNYLTDWYMSNKSRGFPPIPESGLMNGVGRYNCAFAALQGQTCSTSKQRYPVFEVVRGKRYRIRVINTAAIASFNISIDNHKMAVIEVDGVDTQKVSQVDAAILAPAMRYSLVVKMNADGDQHWIRAGVQGAFAFDPGNSNPYPESFHKNILGILRYVDDRGFGWRSLLNPALQSNSFGQIDSNHELDAVRNEFLGSISNFSSIFSKKIEERRTVFHEAIVRQGRPATHDIDTTFRPSPETGSLHPNFLSTAGVTEITNSVHYNQPINYEFLNSPNLPTTTGPTNPILLDPNQCRPHISSPTREAPSYYNQSFTLYVDIKTLPKGLRRFAFNNIVYKLGNKPALYQAINREKITRSMNPINTKFGRGVVIQLVINVREPVGHPFHLHGHTFWVVGNGKAGDGDYNPTSDASKLFLNGVRRDTTSVLGQSWTVLRYYADNPGVWLFHCHINWHFQGGLGLVFVEGGPAKVEIALGGRVPEEGIQVCRRAGISVM